MYRIHRDPPFPPAPRSLQREQQVGQLRVQICLESAPPRPAPGDVIQWRASQVPESVRDRGQVDDMPPCGLELAKEELGKEEVAQVVGGERRLEPVRGQHPPPGVDAGVVDQQVDGRQGAGDPAGDPANLRQVGQVGHHTVPVETADPRHIVTGTIKHPGQGPSDTRVRTCNDHDPCHISILVSRHLNRSTDSPLGTRAGMVWWRFLAASSVSARRNATRWAWVSSSNSSVSNRLSRLARIASKLSRRVGHSNRSGTWVAMSYCRNWSGVVVVAHEALQRGELAYVPVRGGEFAHVVEPGARVRPLEHVYVLGDVAQPLHEDAPHASEVVVAEVREVVVSRLPPHLVSGRHGKERLGRQGPKLEHPDHFGGKLVLCRGVDGPVRCLLYAPGPEDLRCLGEVEDGRRVRGMNTPSGWERSSASPTPPSPMDRDLPSLVPLAGRWQVIHAMLRFPLRTLSNASACPSATRSCRTGDALGSAVKPCTAANSRTSRTSSARGSFSGICESQEVTMARMETSTVRRDLRCQRTVDSFRPVSDAMSRTLWVGV